MKALTDATCVRVLTSEKLLVAIGNNLMLYYVDANGATKRKHAFTTGLQYKINGVEFHTDENFWLIGLYAGPNIFTVRLSKDVEFSNLVSSSPCNNVTEFLFYPKEFIALVQSKNRLNDRISSLKVIDSETICFITSHGVFVFLSRIHSGEWFPDEYCPCDDSSTLYCSSIVGNSKQDLVCFSGTALGLLLIWKPTGPQKGQVLNSIGAHNGVIFSIACDLQRGFIATTSDDRSVKLWKLTAESHEENKIVLKERWYCHGHTARVFHCRIFCDAESMWIVSIGEDSNMCLWDESGSLLVKKRLEDGSTLWSSDYDAMTKSLFVSASNGNVATVCLQNYLNRNTADTTMQAVLVDINREKLSKVKFLADGSLAAVSDHGKVIVLRDALQTVDVVDCLETFKCSILDASGDEIYVAGDNFLNIYRAASEKGTSVVLKKLVLSFDREEFLSETEPVKFSIIRSLHFCRKKDFIVCDNNGRCLVYSRGADALKSCHRLPKTKERWLTSVYGIENFLLLADRAGNLWLYEEHSSEPIDKLLCLHGKLGITDIQLEEQTQVGCFFLSSGHDGHLRSFFLDYPRRRLQIYGSERTPINWIDRIYMKPEQLVVGFNENRFVVCNFQKEVLFEVDCGGGHRYWDCIREDASDAYCLVCIKHKQLKTVRFSSRLRSNNLLKIPQYRCHSKACNVVQIVKTSDACLIISGGEDNLLLVNKFSLETGQLLDYPRGSVVSSHISSIKSICYSYRLVNECGKILIISSGGRAQICLTTLDETTLRTKNELNYMLKSSDQDRSRWRSNRNASFDPETRFMCSVFIESDSGLLVGCSDGFLRYFKIINDDGKYQIELVKEVNYGRCFLHVTSLSIAGHLVFLTMATDGFVCFWNGQDLETPFYKLQHHASGINGFDIRSSGDGWFMIATGGDDQAVAVSKCRLSLVGSGKLSFQLLSTVIQPNVHLGQITGVRFENDNTLLSVGIDQMIYRICLNNLVVTQKWFSCISDVKGIERIADTSKIFVYGCGFEFLNVQTFEK
ncbi:WD repeat-containing protein 6 [Sabethes cyaneus]|uniref:WD repeat-containing protein 6 n=1 Tax=Sabethes cyaneus TaxID=53552 RepID=UPI00237EC871|nr:WD repeat-containing protein 6 [Sabethes cyaneus]